MSSHKLVEIIDLEIARNNTIIEIGSSRPTDSFESSTRYFFEISKAIGAKFYSVDVSAKSFETASDICGECAVQQDGSKFLIDHGKEFEKNIAILYLDNFDVVYNDKHKSSLLTRADGVYGPNGEHLNNDRSAEVHLAQVIAALPNLTNNGVVIFDDTQLRDGDWWGKGATGVPYLIGLGFRVIDSHDDGCILQRPN